MTFSPIVPFDRQDYLEHDSLEEALDFSKYKYDLWQPKMDGIWARVEVRGHRVFVYSRDSLLKETFDLEQSELFATECTLLAEFMYGSQWAQQPERLGKLYVFDVVMLDGVSLRDRSYGERYKLLSHYIYNKHRRFLPVPCYRMHTLGQWWQQNLTMQGFEGVCLRRWGDLYSGKIGKLKREVEDDFVVMDMVMGEGKHLGRMGSLVLGQYRDNVLSPVMTCGGGYSDKERQIIHDEFPKYQGQVCTVKGKGRFISGALRHPEFIQFRYDKPPTQCLLKKPSSLSTNEAAMNTRSVSNSKPAE